ncbi:MAG: class I SAM-dependent methyltransferase [Phycisphaerae bacterium]|nr:class I SAM-dependent methyltransferase [Phycisphaerae bacterium]
MYETEQLPLLRRFLAEEEVGTVVDMGAGLGHHTGQMLESGRKVIAIDLAITDSLCRISKTATDRCRLLRADMTRPPFAACAVEAIWASHCLEHVLDPLSVLAEWRRLLRPDGLLAVIVPPFKTQVVGRHVHTGWTVGQLMLALFRAGFDVRNGAYARHLYNVCAIVRRCGDPPELGLNDEILCRYHDRFPPSIEAEIIRNRRTNTFNETISCFEGDIDRLGW